MSVKLSGLSKLLLALTSVVNDAIDEGWCRLCGAIGNESHQIEHEDWCSIPRAEQLIERDLADE